MKISPRQYTSANGFTILVGRNSRENSCLSLKYADKKDLFLHVSDFPGSHVILRHQDNTGFTMQDITDAARLAVHYSKAKKKRVKVDYTPVSEVSRGDFAGEVELRKFKTCKVEVDIPCIDRILLTKTVFME